MFKMSEIKELMKLVDQLSVHELEIENDGARLLIRKSNKPEHTIVAAAPMMPVPAEMQHSVPPTAVSPLQGTQPAQPAANAADSGSAADENLHQIVSPMVGTFYHAPSPGAEPFVEKGSIVGEKSVVCIIEAMKLMNPIEAEMNGEIVRILVENGQLVEYGQPLFLVKPE